ncbi:hypothetical protein LGL55_10655 [Clostridium tagluense]|uniref:hypothetical protein n=1 Tax=Clostridium tagluense TaxID=360422 RepID=UPI001CF37A8A|nr:hypothetical protein [Clostridium tagluense]MCB2311600.1 hypothetical protein [Clostridium tagluense]MCB2316324.1 hypothetical protein [Clostridium tagluense]MCB2321292.1 hypothetical protein [Clostridium tagluense]MCB2326193.1 hypothetical protein [Clostridium tagluense]MCB2331028.1 hypothetical protein [Clostridium tagluense]
MSNLEPIIEKIRHAEKGKEVRGSIADGIEAINAEVINTTARQLIVEGEQALVGQKEANIQIAEAIREGNEEKRKSTFNSNELNRANTFVANEASRVSTFNANELLIKNNEDGRISTFNANETDRKNRFAVSELSRQTTVTELEDIFNNSTLTGNLPIFIDGGDYGDTNIGTTYNGGDY